MIIDNFDQICNYLPNERIGNEFYFLQILQRKKDNNTIGSNSISINTYYIYNKQHILDKKEEIMWLCNHYNARAYIHLTPRDKDKIILPFVTRLLHHIENKDTSTIHRCFDSICGSYTKEKKYWVIDIDFCKFKSKVDCTNYILGLTDYIANDIKKYVDIISTPNGYHIITQKFDSTKLLKIFSDIEIKKNSPTLLYFNKK